MSISYIIYYPEYNRAKNLGPECRITIKTKSGINITTTYFVFSETTEDWKTFISDAKQCTEFESMGRFSVRMKNNTRMLSFGDYNSCVDYSSQEIELPLASVQHIFEDIATESAKYTYTPLT